MNRQPPCASSVKGAGRAPNRRRPAAHRALALLLGALAFGLGGCWAAALELLPLGISATQAVGSGAMNLATNSSSSSDLHPGEDEVDRHERCDDLEQSAPMVIELRRAAADAPPQWRELQIQNASGKPRWTLAPASDAAAHWQTAQNLLKMNFTPPLALPPAPNVPTYLGYAPSEPRSAAEQDELTGLTANFGAAAGTFLWNGRPYQYTTAARLPCFPLDVALK